MEYGKTEKYGGIIKQGDNSTVHSINLTGLEFLTPYHYRVISCIVESCNRSSNFTFKTGHKQCSGGSSYIAEGDFCIDNFEASMVQGKIIIQGGRIPTSSISRADAQSACRQVGKRLCTSAEFTASCNIRGEKYGDLGDNECNSWNSSYVPTGKATNCTSKEGVHDLVGNFWEWVSDSVNDKTPFYEGLVERDDILSAGKDYVLPRQFTGETLRHGSDYYYNWEQNRATFIGTGIVRGGYYASQKGGGCFSYIVGAPLEGDQKIGFRCCS